MKKLMTKVNNMVNEIKETEIKKTTKCQVNLWDSNTKIEENNVK